MSLSVCRPVPAEPPCAFRACFGALMVVHTYRLATLGMYERAIMAPSLHFHYGGALRHVTPPPTPNGAQLHLAVLALSALGVALGIGTRSCASLFALAYSYFVLIEKATFNNHYYLYVLMAGLIALVRADQALSLRPASAARPRVDAPASAPAWQRDLLRLQVCVVYFYAGIAKLNADWCLHSQPMATKLADEASVYNPSLRPLLSLPATARAVSIGGVAFDLLIAPLLLYKPSRPLACLVATLFHLSNHFLWSLGEFPWVMIATTLLFCDDLPPAVGLVGSQRSASTPPPPPSADAADAARGTDAATDGASCGAASGAHAADRQPLRRRHVSGSGSAEGAPSPAPSAAQAPTGKAPTGIGFALALGALHATVQLLLPLRWIVASGFDPLDAVHTKAHTLLSWRMMAVSTRNFINVSFRSEGLGATVQMTRTYNRLRLIWPNGSVTPLPLTPMLQPRQAGYAPYNADLLTQFARAAAVRHGCAVDAGGGAAGGRGAARTSGSQACRVVGSLWSSINGRPFQRFVDGSTDLLSCHVSRWSRPAWVLPLLYDYGSTTWRSRMAWLRSKLRASGFHMAFFADDGGGVFEESFPSMDRAFPPGSETRPLALLLPLHGSIALDIPEPRNPAARAARATTTLELHPPAWSVGAAGEIEMEPSTPPAEVPFGRPHAVRVLGAGGACWAYVFGVGPQRNK